MARHNQLPAFFSAMVLGAVAASGFAGAAPNCASVFHVTGKYGTPTPIVKATANNAAIQGWEAKARKKFNDPAIRWSWAKRKSLKYKFYSPVGFSVRATGTVCIKQARKPNRATTRCQPNDFKCKAKLFKHKKRFTTTPDGIKAGLNPQPEPPSKVRLKTRQ